MYNSLKFTPTSNPSAGDTFVLGGRTGAGVSVLETFTFVASESTPNEVTIQGNLTDTISHLGGRIAAHPSFNSFVLMNSSVSEVIVSGVNINRSISNFFLGIVNGTGNFAGVGNYTDLAGDTKSLTVANANITAGTGADTIDVFNATHLATATINGGSSFDTIYVIGDEASVTLGATMDLVGVESLVVNPRRASPIAVTINQMADFDSLNHVNLATGTLKIGAASTGMVDITLGSLTAASIVRESISAGAIKLSVAFNGSVVGSAGAETLIGGTGAETLDGGAGSDSVEGGAGADFVIGGANDDTLIGGAGADTIHGQTDNDLILIGVGDWAAGEHIVGGANADTLQFDDANIDLGTATVFNTVETIVGTHAGGFALSLTPAVLADVVAIKGGAGTDLVVVNSGHGDFSTRTLTSIEILRLGTANNLLVLPTGVTLQAEGTAGNSDVIRAAAADVISGVQTFNFGAGTADRLEITGGGTIDFSTFATVTGAEDVQAFGANTVHFKASNTQSLNYIGSTGADTLSGGALADTQFGGQGADTLYGSASGDRLDGGDGNDLIVYTAATDLVNDTIDGGPGTGDLLRLSFHTPNLASPPISMAGIDTIEVPTNNSNSLTLTAAQLTGLASIDLDAAGTDDLIVHGSTTFAGVLLLGVERVISGVGGNSITLPAGKSLIGLGSPGNGNDTFVASLADVASNTQQFGLSGGTDRVVLTGGGTIDLGALALFSDVEEVLLQGGGSFIVSAGSATARTYLGESGNDKITGGTLADTMFGGTGGDTLDGADGADVLVGELGTNVLTGGNGADSLFGGVDADTLHGGMDNDVIVGGDQNDLATGGTGADLLYGQNGADSLSGDAGDDSIVGGAGADSLDGGDDTDVLDGGADNDTITGGTDFVQDFLIGGDGSDDLSLRDGDIAWGGNGNDLFRVMSTGAILVADFTPGTDLINLTYMNGAWTGAAGLTAMGAPVIGTNGLVYTFSNITLTIVGTTTALVAADIA